MNWFRDLWAEWIRLIAVAAHPLRRPFSGKDSSNRLALCAGLSSVAISLTVAFVLASKVRNPSVEPVPIPELNPGRYADRVFEAVRTIPVRFRANERMPTRSEKSSSGTLDDSNFHPEFDLVRIEDDRVWWESEHDKGDTEDDHLFHRVMEEPFRCLVHLVSESGATLKVQDVYRPEGVHHSKSLHKQGRAIDITAKDMSLSELGKLAWAAGFDWVFYESPRGGGAHIHASMRAAPIREKRIQEASLLPR
jgi:hypothetical protein